RMFPFLHCGVFGFKGEFACISTYRGDIEMSAQRIVRIGQKAFVLSHDGEVIRTMVARLEEDGYQFLDGSSHHRPHWFAFKNAVGGKRSHRRSTNCPSKKPPCAGA
ncbi:MAG: hypothetical protein AAB951_00595, partial [Patescibacteria group bacterium]